MTAIEAKLKKGIDYTGITIVYFCHDGNGRFIMAQRSNQARDEQGRWDVGGGGLEFGDTIENTLRKEIKEEYCTEVLDYEYLGYRDVHREHEGKKTHWITFDFKVLVNPSLVQIGEPHKFDDIGWFTLENLPEPIHSQLPNFLNLYRHKL